ncbi:MAG: DUF502 domain-containing protein [Candidatus Marinimicrobia bacterium]|nr:DUF502 domain-containing protein [Candidatus Neomarinimicrobiota bacterium]MCF7829875.1 DUF502 domain-containing protein [Candidatus Neomarinimicrobiota bacterium]MCF7879162.1 DUF502 domain-containing protein [Candidatus Neomarinimicrobiota bacterium]
MNRVWASIRNKLLTGLLVLGPLGLTALVLRWIFNFFDGFLGPYLRHYVEWYVPGMGIILTVAAVYLIGLLASNFIGKKSLQVLERVLARIPLVKNVYSTAKSIFQAFSLQGKSSFKKVVLIQYPRKGLWTLAFVTGTTTGDDGEEYHSMFVPSTPNPTTGYVIFIKKSEAIDTRFTVEQGLKLLISGGMILPEEMSLGDLPEETE